MNEKNKIKNIIYVVTVLLVYISILILNCNTGLVADDYNQSFITGSDWKKITSIKDIIISLQNFRIYINGRIIGEFFMQISLLMGKNIFNFLNAGVYVCVILLMQYHIEGKKGNSALMFASIHICMWIFQPSFGQTVLWIAGSCNYLWTMLIILLFLIPYRNQLENIDSDKKHSILMMFFCGIVAGWTNENTGVAMIIFIILCYVYCVKKRKKSLYWMISGCIGSIIGYTLMIFSPGNFERIKTAQPLTFLQRIIRATRMEFEYMGLLVALILLLYVYYKYSNSNNKMIFSVMYVFVSICANYAMALSPLYPKRAMSGVVVFTIIAFFNAIINCDFKPLKIKEVIYVGYSCLLLLYVSSFIHAYININKINTQREKRLEYVISERNRNNLNIKVDTIMGTSKYDATYQCGDIMIDPEYWSNVGFAKYYGLESVTGTYWYPDTDYWKDA